MTLRLRNASIPPTSLHDLTTEKNKIPKYNGSRSRPKSFKTELPTYVKNGLNKKHVRNGLNKRPHK